jgi:hypothetical protein
MKKSIVLAAILAVASSMAHGWAVYLVNETNQAVKVNVGCIAMKASFHIAMSPKECKRLSTAECSSCNGVNYIPQWVSAYRYEGHWENERTIREDKDIQTCTGDRLLVIREDDIVCKRWEDLPTDCGPHVTVPNGDLTTYRCLIYKTATGWDFD